MPGFDFGNSPSALARADLSGRHVVISTAAGVRGLHRFRRARRVFAASLVCAAATAEAIRRSGADEVCFVITGEWHDRDGDEPSRSNGRHASDFEIAPMRLPAVPADFAGAIKGLRSVASMEDRLHSLLASAKVACDALARSIRTNLAAFKEQAADFEFLFVDLSQIVHKAPDDFAVTLQARIAAHRVAEEARESARKKAAEEAARLAAEAAARAATPPATATAVVTMPVAADQPPAQPVAAAPAPAARTTTIPRELLLRVLRRPVTRTDADVTLLSEYAQAAADLIEQQDRVIAQLRKDLREEQREAQRSVREAVAEDRWARAQGEEYGSY